MIVVECITFEDMSIFLSAISIFRRSDFAAAAGWEDIPEHSQPNNKSVCYYNI